MRTLLALGGMFFLSGTFLTAQDAVNYTVRYKPLSIHDQASGKILARVPKNKSVVISSYNLQCDCFSARYMQYEGIMHSKAWLGDVYAKPLKKNGHINEISDSVKMLLIKYRLANDKDPDAVFNIVKSDGIDYSEQRTLSLINKWGYTDGKRIAEGKVWPGMTIDMALESWGIPYRVNRTRGSWGFREQWIYSEAYLYFENGVLSEIFRLGKKTD